MSGDQWLMWIENNLLQEAEIPKILAPAQSGGQQLAAPKIEVIREPTPDRKSSLAPGVYCSMFYAV